MHIEHAEALALARDAAKGAGASQAMAESLARATVAAEWAGHKGVGFAHLLDYLDGLIQGRIQPQAQAAISYPTPAVIRVDVQGGIAQLGFDQVFDELVHKGNTFGMATLLLNNSFTTGEIGYYTRRLAEAGLVAMACTNAGAQMTTQESGKAVFGTNPLSFAVPRPHAKPMVIDQASSATAFVNVRRAAEAGEPIPLGWALGPDGTPTTDAQEAVKGLLLPFGGMRGANIALMVESLSAGLAGGNWSTEAPHFASGNASPGVGLFVMVLAPALIAPEFTERFAKQLEHLAAQGVRIPGSHIHITALDVAEATLERVRQYVKV